MLLTFTLFPNQSIILILFIVAAIWIVGAIMMPVKEDEAEPTIETKIDLVAILEKDKARNKQTLENSVTRLLATKELKTEARIQQRTKTIAHTDDLETIRAEFESTKDSINYFLDIGEDAKGEYIRYPDAYREAGLTRCFNDLVDNYDKELVIQVMGDYSTETYSSSRSYDHGLPSYALQDHANPGYR